MANIGLQQDPVVYFAYESMNRLATQVDVEKILYVHLEDEERLNEPFVAGHCLHALEKLPCRSWSSNPVICP